MSIYQASWEEGVEAALLGKPQEFDWNGLLGFNYDARLGWINGWTHGFIIRLENDLTQSADSTRAAPECSVGLNLCRIALVRADP
jgi:hypothetical protein